MVLVLTSSILIVELAGGVSRVGALARQWWPGVLIAIALIRLVQGMPWRWVLLGPSVLTGLGLAFLGVTVAGIRGLYLQFLAPIGLGLLGIILALGGSQHDRTPTPQIRSSVWLGTKRIRGYGEVFRYAAISACCGLLELDLRRMTLIDNAHINLTCFFACVDISLPPFTVVDLALPMKFSIGVTTDDQPPSAGQVKPPIDEEGYVRISVLGFGARVNITGEDLRFAQDELRTSQARG
jgi:hypothetical protein